MGLVCLHGEIRDTGGEHAQRFRAKPVVGVPAAWFGRDEACFAKNTQVVADGGLPRPGVVHEVTGAHLLACEQAHDLRAQRIPEEFHRGVGDSS